MKTLAVYYFFFYLAMSAYVPYTSLFFSDKGFSSSNIGLILSLWALVSLVAQPVMGMITDRMADSRKMLMLCIAAASLFGLGFYYFDQLALILAVSVLFSWFQSSFGSLSDSVAIGIGNRSGFSFASIRLWGALSYSLGAFATGFLYAKFGYDWIFFVYLAFNAFVFAALFFFPKPPAAPHKTSVFEQINEVWRNRPFLVFLGINILIVMSTMVSTTFLPLYFKELDFDKSWLGSAFAIAALVEVPMFLVAVKLRERIGRFWVLFIAAALYTVKYAFLFLFHSLYLTLALHVIDGIAFAFAAGISVEIVDRFASDKSKATFQTVYVAGTWGVGGIVGNAAGGYIVDGMGAPFLYFILFLAVGLATLLFALNRKKLSAAG